MLSALQRVGRRVERWVDEGDPFTNVYGLARTMLALAAAATLLANHASTLFFPTPSTSGEPVCTGVRAAGAYCLSHGHTDVARLACAAILLVVATGWRPRFTAPLHAWVAFSFQSSAVAIEGGDQVTGILTLLLLPVALCDDRTWHWSKRAPRAPDERERLRRLVAKTFLGLVRLQVAGIYLHAAIAKFKVPEWADGTVIYYWFTHPTFGVPDWLAPIAKPALLLGPVVAAITWGTLVLELGLAAGLIARRRYRPWLLAGGFALHGGIILVHGLVSFAIVMFAALILFLHPVDRSLVLPERLRRLARALPRPAIFAWNRPAAQTVPPVQR